jgi:hypothetical protein
VSKRINVNPGHYKTAGRERQGDDVVADVEKRQFTTGRRAARGRRRKARAAGPSPRKA